MFPSLARPLDALKSKKEQYEKIIEYQTKSAILRSGSRWHNEGEKNTKCFLNLEKRHHKQGTINQLRTNSDNFIIKDNEILKECLCFYKSLYTTKLTHGQDPSINQFFFVEECYIHVSKAEEISCEGLLTETECLPSLKQMADSKTTGTDGLPAELYKTFWNDIIAALNFAYESQQTTNYSETKINKIHSQERKRPQKS